MTAKRLTQAVALALAVAAFVFVSLQPGATIEQYDENGQIISSVTSIALLNMRPMILASVILAVLFTAIPFAPQGRSRPATTVVSAVLMVLLTFVAVASASNWFIVPAAVASVAAVFMPAASRSRSRSESAASSRAA